MSAQPGDTPAPGPERSGTTVGPDRPHRIGILGGTFDPPHCGHVRAALACRAALSLDRVLLVVANEPWQKVPQRDVTPAGDRYAMVEAAVAGIEGVDACRIEIDRGGPSYTVDTVRELLEEASSAGAPRPELFLIVGADLVESLPTWKQVDSLRSEVVLAVVARPRASPLQPSGWRSIMVEGDDVDVSSSEVRLLLEGGLRVDGLVPDSVVRCIRRRSLYAVDR